MSREEVEEYIERIASELGEHFDAAQIMVTWNDGGTTCALHRGSGNWYARQGMAHEFINEDVAQEHARQLSDILEPVEDGPDEEAWKS